MSVKNLDRFAKLFDLGEKVAVVTGGAMGNGLGISNALADAGAQVVACDLKFSEPLAGYEDQVLREGIQKKILDITKEDMVKQVFAEIDVEFGRIDILINNAGICFERKLIPEQDLDKFRAVIDVNLLGTVTCTKSVIPFMKKNNGGKIVNISSSQAYLRTNGASPYAASKTAISHLTRIWGNELAPDNIYVNALCPSYVMTPMMENSIITRAEAMGIDREEMVHVYTDEVPLRKFVTVEEVANWATLLCSDFAVSVTGTNFALAAGQVQL